MPPAQKRGILNSLQPRSDGANRIMEWIPALNKTYEDTLFEAGDSPVLLDFFGDQGWNAIQGWITCDGIGGAGNIIVDFSRDGIIYGDSWTMRPGENTNLKGFDIHTLRITHTGIDSAYRVFLI